MRLRINGETRELANGLSLLELIKELDLPDTRIAVELNCSVIRRSEWASIKLKEDDQIEIVHFVGGG
ncbi:MAG: sulfur carrier protein ThiS [Pyrinomonadaceae bacterium]